MLAAAKRPQTSAWWLLELQRGTSFDVAVAKGKVALAALAEAEENMLGVVQALVTEVVALRGDDADEQREYALAMCSAAWRATTTDATPASLATALGEVLIDGGIDDLNRLVPAFLHAVAVQAADVLLLLSHSDPLRAHKALRLLQDERRHATLVPFWHAVEERRDDCRAHTTLEPHPELVVWDQLASLEWYLHARALAAATADALDEADRARAAASTGPRGSETVDLIGQSVRREAQNKAEDKANRERSRLLGAVRPHVEEDEDFLPATQGALSAAERQRLRADLTMEVCGLLVTHTADVTLLPATLGLSRWVPRALGRDKCAELLVRLHEAALRYAPG